MATAASASSFLGSTRVPELQTAATNGGKFHARFGFGTKKKNTPKITVDRPLWFLGAKAPEYLDGSIVGDYGFDPFGLGKPAEYLQYDLDSLDQNLAKNNYGEIIGTRFETDDVKSTPFQPYTEVFGLQRFRECELIHGRWAMLATLGALAVEALTGITWQDAGKVELIDGSSYLGQPLPFSITTLIWIEVLVIGYIEFQRNAELEPEKRLYPGGSFFDPPASLPTRRRRQPSSWQRSSTPASPWSDSWASQCKPPRPEKDHLTTGLPTSVTHSTPPSSIHSPPPLNGYIFV